MKKIILFLALIVVNIGNAQILKPIKWTTSVTKISDTEYNLVATATIDSGWHLYSQDVPEGGPIPTTFSYDNANNTFKTLDNTIEKDGHIIDDPVFQMKIKLFFTVGKSSVF